MQIILVMSGGNALGAFHAGAYEALHAAGMIPHWVAGSSVGAVTAALIAGNRAEDRIGALREFWRRAALPRGPSRAANRPSSLSAVMAARMVGRPRLFAPVVARWSPEAPLGHAGLNTLAPLQDTLGELVDFARANAGAPRLTVQATDLATGAGVVFDTHDVAVGPLHLMASSALPVDFEPVTIDGRVLCDGGMSANLPVASALRPPPRDETLCVAVDLFPAKGGIPTSLEDMMARRYDLLLSAQATKEIEIVRLEHAADRAAAPLLLAHVVHDGAGERVGQKMFDFSAEAIADRWDAGRRVMRAMLARMQASLGGWKGFRYFG